MKASSRGVKRLRLLPDHRISVQSGHVHGWPTTAAALITPIVAMLLRVAPGAGFVARA